MKKIIICLTLLILALPVYSQYNNKRALRGVWIATVANIDFPTKPGLSVEKQKEEMIFLLDKVKSHNMNTIILQIRPAADAFYNSQLEPSSRWLTGKQGADVGYDPLQFAIDECHKRGLYIHAWINPFRITGDTILNKTFAKNHIIHRHPEWTISYRKEKFFNPGLDEVREFTCRVVKDIVSNYDIDALHVDDAFYPWVVKEQEFPDSRTFAKYPRGFTNREDWRRNNVNLLVQEISKTIKSIKPWVEFGISPSGVSTHNYNSLYADVSLWQKEGWIDYVLPQLYFNIGFSAADYAVWIDWWAKNDYGTIVYAGLAPYKVSKQAKQTAWHTSEEIIRQINLNRKYPNLKGEVFFSAKAIFKNPAVDLEERLRTNEYKTLSISPENNRIARIEPENPLNVSMQITDGKNILLKWERGKNAKRFVIYKFEKDKPIDIDNPTSIIEVTGLTEIILRDMVKDLQKYRFAVTSLSPTHTESTVVFAE
ncbi:MAG: family 10 glycosylhydrolase [Prevotellaceae bacterium]|jgi:uncharacterized lipoprotein YddW (UPF0748 family)|nr:family 10 glycosylhydrolase [Prevotellaceae bacterium]